MRQITVDLYQLDELDEAAQEAAHAEWMRCMGGYAEDVQTESWDQGCAIDRFLKAVPWARGDWGRSDIWHFYPVNAYEVCKALDARAQSEWDWWDYGPREAFNEAMEARAGKIKRAARVYLESTSQERSDRAGRILEKACNEALEAAARAINDDWQAMLEELQSFDHFADMSGACGWEYTAAGAFQA